MLSPTTLSFSVFALVLGERPMRTGLWFFFGALLLVYVVRALRRPRDPKRVTDMVEKMSGLASSPAIAIVAAGASLANPGGFIPVALKDISQLNPSAGEYILLWVGFALISLLPLSLALLM